MFSQFDFESLNLNRCFCFLASPQLINLPVHTGYCYCKEVRLFQCDLKVNLNQLIFMQSPRKRSCHKRLIFQRSSKWLVIGICIRLTNFYAEFSQIDCLVLEIVAAVKWIRMFSNIFRRFVVDRIALTLLCLHCALWKKCKMHWIWRKIKSEKG